MSKSLVAVAAAFSFRACLSPPTEAREDGPLVEDLAWLGPIPDAPGCVVRGAVRGELGCWLHPWTDETGAPGFSLEVGDAEGEPLPPTVDGVFVLRPDTAGPVAGNADLFVYALNVSEEASGDWWSNQEDPTFPDDGETEQDVVQPFEVTFAHGTLHPIALRALAREGQRADGSLVQLAARFPDAE